MNMGIPLSAIDYGTAYTDLFGVFLLFSLVIFGVWLFMR